MGDNIIISIVIGVIVNIISGIKIDNLKGMILKIKNVTSMLFKTIGSSFLYQKIKWWFWKCGFALRCVIFPKKYLSEKGMKQRWKIWKFWW